MSAILIPAALTLAIVTRPVLMVWTGDLRITTLVAPVLSLLALGTMFNGLMIIPYNLQLAYGWTSLSVSINTFSVLVMVPVMFVAVNHFGMIGAASACVILNVFSLVVSAHFMYARIMRAAKGYWYRNVILMPLIAGAFFLLVFSHFFPELQTRVGALVELIVCVPLMLVIVLSVLPNLRSHAYGWWKEKWRTVRLSSE
jgi:O-antigen/teichoic acid export membrane protein